MSLSFASLLLLSFHLPPKTIIVLATPSRPIQCLPSSLINTKGPWWPHCQLLALPSHLNKRDIKQKRGWKQYFLPFGWRAFVLRYSFLFNMDHVLYTTLPQHPVLMRAPALTASRARTAARDHYAEEEEYTDQKATRSWTGQAIISAKMGAFAST